MKIRIFKFEEDPLSKNVQRISNYLSYLLQLFIMDSEMKFVILIKS